MSQFPSVICLMGPTAAGKTDLAIKLTQHLPCEIISVDSAMVYRGMNIGTAKPGPEILRLAPHRLLDIRDPSDAYSAGQFRTDALREITDILSAGKIPLLVGGTMLYFHALQTGLAELPPANNAIRAFILEQAKIHGWQTMHQRLQKIDPLAANRIHPNDPQRIQRALEIYELTGQSLTTLANQNHAQSLPYRMINLAIAPTDRSRLHTVIEQRFHIMLEQGFIAEVEKLFLRSDLTLDLPSIRSVGYRQIWSYLAGDLNYEAMKERSIIATRQLAKRQLTWLKSWRNTTWFASEDDKRLDKILNFLNSVTVTPC